MSEIPDVLSKCSSTCGPGPFSMAGEETDRAMLEAAGFSEVDVFRRIDADVCVGTDLEEAIVARKTEKRGGPFLSPFGHWGD